MLLAYIALAAVAVALLRGGRLSNLGTAPLKCLWLPIAAFALEAAIGPLVRVLPWPYEHWLWLVVLAGYLLLGAFLVLNRHFRSVGLLEIGTVLNFAVISSNHWQMPVSPLIYNIPKLAPVLEKMTTGTLVEYAVATEATKLLWLGDVIRMDFIPGMSFGSVGDFFLGAGIFWLVQEAMVPRVKSKK